MACSNAIAVFDQRGLKGTIRFHQCRGQRETFVDIDLHDMQPNRTRAIHIHDLGDTSGGCKTLGPHWNPDNKQHGSIWVNIHDSHAGDMINNFTSDKRGKFRYSYVDPRIQIRGDITESIIGRSVVIHDGEDDLGLGGNAESKITGNAGGRFGCAVIGHAKDGQIN